MTQNKFSGLKRNFSASPLPQDVPLDPLTYMPAQPSFFSLSLWDLVLYLLGALRRIYQGGPVSTCWHCWLLNPPLLNRGVFFFSSPSRGWFFPPEDKGEFFLFAPWRRRFCFIFMARMIFFQETSYPPWKSNDASLKLNHVNSSSRFQHSRPSTSW